MALGGKGLTAVRFTGNSSWTAPAGVTQAIVIGMGGGSGGAGGGSSIAGRALGGNGSVPAMKIVPVTPNTSYTILIGAGGAGANATAGLWNGSPGGDSYFGTVRFRGANPILSTDMTAQSFSDFSEAMTWNFGTAYSSSTINGNISFNQQVPSCRGPHGASAANGTNPSGGFGGGGGAAGYTGPGGAGGNYSGGVASNGSAAASTNFGAGGGGGGNLNSTTKSGGGAGAPGAIWVIWTESTSKLTQVEFTSSGTWVAPAGVSSILALGQGGGGGGSSGSGPLSIGSQGTGGFGGKCANLVANYIEVSPGTSYTVTIGAGGASDTNGGDTSFGVLRTWYGALAGGNGSGYTTIGNAITNVTNPIAPISLGGAANGNANAIPYVVSNPGAYGTAGTRGAQGGTDGGGGGAAGNASDHGPGGDGGAGGIQNAGGGLANGQDAPAATSYGAGGGGGGGKARSGTVQGLGGQGGGGRLIILWAE